MTEREIFHLALMAMLKKFAPVDVEFGLQMYMQGFNDGKAAAKEVTA